MKICSKCGKSKPASKFNKDKSKPGGLYSQCRKCRQEYNRKNRAKRKELDLKSNYGLTLSDFSNLIESQNGYCVICGDSFEATTPCVDHCHSTGQIRGVLCRSCNTMLGQAKDNPQILLSGVSYLFKTSKLGE